ncbi:MAG TPA: protein phosphatase 2C domain-containing protein [Candidatus Limnocylindria bacterium]|nr:protein phosphatase 2C domain-containing protein [Candidatus Limnocylindria bacterium]
MGTTTDLAARTDPGLVRERNEDRWLTRTYAGVTLIAVADGVGGEAGGDVASTAAIEGLANSFAPPSFRESARSALASAVQRANAAVLEASTDERFSRAATTLVAAAIRGREAAIANLGDSRAYLIRGRSIRQLTADHSGDAASSITRFLGDPRGVQPDIFVETLQAADRLVLCSDGLTRHVTDPEIASAMTQDASRAADALVALARSRGGEDNITVIVYAAKRPAISRALAGTLILAVLILVAIAGAMGALLATPIPTAAPPVSPSPSASASPTEAPSPSPSVAPTPSASP